MTVDILGHRGMGATNHDREMQLNSGIVENTIPSFQRAIHLGCCGIELDVAVTKDGEVVVIHDDELYKNVIDFHDDNQDSPQLVRDYTLSELQKFNVGGGCCMPSLREVLSLVKEQASKEFIVNIEVKGENSALPSLDLVKKNTGIEKSNVIINSFRWEKLKNLRKEDGDIKLVPNLKTVQLFGESNVEMPGFVVDAERSYQGKFKKEYHDLHSSIGCYAIDLTAYDFREELVNLVSQENVGICLSETYSKNAGETLQDELRFIHGVIGKIKSLSGGIRCLYKTNRPKFAIRDVKNKFIAEDCGIVA